MISASVAANIKRYMGATSVDPTTSPITVNTNVGGTVIAAANTRRKYIIIQNCGTEPCLIRLGGNPAADVYNFVLEDGTANRDGKGASLRIDNYQGAIKGLTEANSTIIAIMEILEA